MKQLPKVYVFHTECVYSRGGEKYLFQLLKRVSRDFSIHLLVQAVSPEWQKLYEENQIKVSKLWKPARFYWALLPLFLIVNWWQLRRKIKPSDVIFATNFPLNYLGTLLSSNTISHCFEPIAIFYDPITISSVPPFSRFCIRVAKFLYSAFDKKAITHTQVLTTLNHEVKKHILAVYGRSPDAFLPNGVDTTFFSPQKRSAKRTYIVGHSTDYTPFKGTENFLKIVTILSQKIPNLKVIITESMVYPDVKDRYMKYIQAHQLSDRVTFIGNLSEKQMVDFYSGLDVFCYTGSPLCAGGSTASLSVLEAQACGTPVVRSIGNTDEIIANKTGYYIDPFRHQAAALTIMKLLATTNRSHMRRQARIHTQQSFSWDTTAKKLRQLITKLIKDTYDQN